mgnify:CR=1 FL=1
MTVAELIKKLQSLPHSMRVKMTYDSAACCVDVVHVGLWRPDADLQDDAEDAKVCVCLFDKTSEDERLRDHTDTRHVKN